jgi:hypothetical protein
MKRIIISVYNFWKRRFLKNELISVSGNVIQANSNEPEIKETPKVVLSSADDSEIGAITSKIQRMSIKTNRQLITDFVMGDDRAANGFTTVQLYVWLNKTLELQAISKTLYKMKTYGLLEASNPELGSRGKVWMIKKNR